MPPKRTTTKKTKNKDQDTLNPVQPNAGIAAEYNKYLNRLIDAMHKSVAYWVRAAYKKDDPVNPLVKTLKDLGKRWASKFADVAPSVAENFVNKAVKNVERNLGNQLKKRDFVIDWQMSEVERTALQASIAENVSLIKSIPSQYLSQVEGSVMRCAARGGDLKTLSEELHTRYGITRNRAALIARDQNAKANAVMARARTLDIGFTEGVWHHSHAGREPRASHVAFDGKKFDIAKGALIDGEYIQPGQLIGCRCFFTVVIPNYTSAKK